VHLVKVKAAFKAAAEERTRMAREIHDTLQQRLVGVLAQLELPAGSNPDPARTLVRSCMAEARRLVQNLRSVALEQGDLAQALNAVAQELTASTRVPIQVSVHGTPRRLSDITENHLLRIGQEALMNAVKHGRPHRIDVDLHFSAGGVKLAIKDDGCGFDTTSAAPPDGHYGVIGMRERAQQLGGRLELASRPGQGTEVRIAVPLES
jgi:signal transduction histidine kinase